MSTISAIQGASSNGRTHSTRAEDVGARVSLTGSATEDTAHPVGADKAVEEIAAEEEPPTLTGVRQMQPTSASRCRSSRTTTAKKHGIERTKAAELAPEEKASVSTLKKRPPAGLASPANRGCGDGLAVRRVQREAR